MFADVYAHERENTGRFQVNDKAILLSGGHTIMEILSIAIVMMSFMLIAASALATDAEQEKDALPELSEGQKWQLVWHDEFDGTEIDTSKWDSPEYERRGHLWRPANAYLDGKGQLVMETSQVGDRYASPCLRTRKKFEKKFGFFITRCKLPKEQGHWSAFWMMNDSVGKVGNEGRDGTEIDIMEWPWRDGSVGHALHWDGYGEHHKSASHKSKSTKLLDGEFHTFALWWSSEQYVFYVDGEEVWRTDAGGVCQAPVYIKLSVEIGDWAGDIRKAKLPDYFVVDYMRVYDAMNVEK